MTFDELLDKFNSYYQILLNENNLFVRKLLLEALSHLLDELVSEFALCYANDDATN